MISNIFINFFSLSIIYIYIYIRGDNLTVQSDHITASAWLDRKMVNVMATGCDTSKDGTVLRCQNDGSHLEVSCPVAVVEYNKYMGGVDRGDQLRGYYQCNFKSRSTSTLDTFFLELLLPTLIF